MAVISNVAPVSNTLTIAGLGTLANGAYSAPSSFLDNTSSVMSYLTCWIRLAFTASVTSGASSPYVVLYIFEARDSSNLPTPPGVGGTVAPVANARQQIIQLSPSTSFQILDFQALDLGPFQHAFSFGNFSGSAFTACTATAYRDNIQSV